MKSKKGKKIGISVGIAMIVIGVVGLIICLGNFGPKILSLFGHGAEQTVQEETTELQVSPVLNRTPLKPETEMSAIWLDYNLDCQSNPEAVQSALNKIQQIGFNTVIFSACEIDKLQQFVSMAEQLGIYSVYYTEVNQYLLSGMANDEAVSALVATGVDSVLLNNGSDAALVSVNRVAEAINAADETVYVGFFAKSAAEYAPVCDAGVFDFKYIDIITPTLAVDDDYITYLSKYIDGTTADTVFGMHTELAGNAEGYEDPAEILSEFEAVTKLDYYGYGFYRFAVIDKNENGLADAIIDFKTNGIMKNFFKQLTISKPDSTTVNTNQSLISFVGTGDIAYPLLINGEAIKMVDNGYFSVEKNLKAGKNTFTFSHKNKVVTYTVNYKLKLIDSVSPAGTLNAPGGTAIEIAVVAYKGAVVKATVNGTTISLKRSDDYSDSESNDNSSDYTYFVGSYTLPQSTSSAVNLGSVKASASYAGLTASAAGAAITVNAMEQPVTQPTPETTVTVQPPTQVYEPITDENGSTIEAFNPTTQPPTTQPTTANTSEPFRLLTPNEYNGVSGRSKMIVVKEKYAETLPSATANDVSVPYFSALPIGTVDYVTGTSSFDGLNYYILSSGRRVYQEDVTYLASGYNMPGNEIKTVGVTKSSSATNIKLTMKWKVPFNVQEKPQSYYTQTEGRPYSVKSYTADYVDITFFHTSSVGAAPQFSSSIVRSAEWVKNSDGSYSLRLRLKKTGGFYGIKYFYNSDNTLTLSIKERPSSSVSGKVIMLDAGHGGSDPGAIGVSVIGSNYVHEATINLSIANKMKAKLESLGATVIMTRTAAGQTISLDDRAASCRAKNPDIFIAVHCDASETSSSASGTTSYYYKSYSYPLAKYLSQSIVSAYKSKIYSNNSSMAAKSDKGAKFKGFRVTRVEECPAVLIEFGFVTNVTECNMLIKDANQKILASAAVDGIVAYFKNS